MNILSNIKSNIANNDMVHVLLYSPSCPVCTHFKAELTEVEIL